MKRRRQLFRWIHGLLLLAALHVPARVTAALVPYPSSVTAKRKQNGGHRHQAQEEMLILKQRNFEIVTEGMFLREAKKRSSSSWFNLPDLFVDYPINPQNKTLLSIPSLFVHVEMLSDDLYFGVDESYSINIHAENATIYAPTLFGAVRAFETFAQLLHFGWIDDNGDPIFVLDINQHDELLASNTSIIIRDAPLFPYRGLLIDTARHYLPVDLLLYNLNAMAMNKLNVMHWHITDSQSWPFASQKYPTIAQKGAYLNGTLVYTPQDIRRIIQEAYFRGIHVIPEFDLPGHSSALTKAYPNFASQCWDNTSKLPTQSEMVKAVSSRAPINPVAPGLKPFLQTLYSEILDLFLAPWVHLGGDEVSLECWEQDVTIQTYMKDHNLTNVTQLFQRFMKQQLNMMQQFKRQSIVWQEVFDLGILSNESETPTSDVIVDVWKHWENSTLYNATAAGYRVLWSACWYLDYLDQSWESFYDNCDPTKIFHSDDDRGRSLLQGGHASMWGEHVDATNFMSRVWPRASSMAERLWTKAISNSSSSSSHGSNVPPSFHDRLPGFRCHMLLRGIDAGPAGPGFCSKEPHFHPTSRVRMEVGSNGQMGLLRVNYS